MKNINTSIFFIIIFILISELTVAQQVPNFTNHIYQPSLFNPARAGADLDYVGVIYRQQYLDLDKKYAPTTINFNLDLSKTIGISDRVGIGLNLTSDKIHVFNRTNVNGFFAYHLTPQESEHHFSAGISAGYLTQRLNFSDIRITDPTGTDNVLFSGEQNKGIFDGGFGIHYRYNDIFNIDLTSPQLFTSDLTYDEGTGFNTLPHLLAATSFKIKTGSTSITPGVLYGGMFGAEKNKSYIDLNLRLGFLDDKFWLGGGYRLDAETFIASIGTDLKGFQLSGTYESHSALGATIEVAAKYQFGNKETSDDDILKIEEPLIEPNEPVVNSGRSKEELTRVFNKQKFKANNASANINRLDKDINKVLKLAEDNFDDANTSSSQEGRKFKLKRVKNYLEQVEPKVQNFITNVATINDARLEANKVFDEAHSKNIKIKKSGKAINQINKEYSSSSKKLRTIETRNRQLNDKIKTFEERHGLSDVDLKKLIQTRDLEGLRKFYQKELDNTLVKPKNTSPIKITETPNTLTLIYQYPSDEEKYNLDKDLRDAQLMTTHIASKINEIQSQGLQIESILIRADLALSNTMLQYNKNATYNGEYGETHSVSIKTYDKETKSSFPQKNLIIKKGTIDLEKLVALKMYSMRKAMVQKMKMKDVLINLELTTGNFNQQFTQLYSIEIKVK